MVDVLTKSSVISFTSSSTPPSSVTGDRYILSVTGMGGWSGIPANSIAEYDGTSWSSALPPSGIVQIATAADALPAGALRWNGAQWEQIFAIRVSEIPYDTLNDINTNAPANTALIIDRSFTLSAATTLTAPLIIFAQGVISTGGHHLYLNAMSAGDFQCFDAPGPGTVNITNGQSINVKWFGAVGDGSTHNNLAFSAAIACVLNLSNGGELYVPSGVYAIEQVLVMSVPTGLVVSTLTKAFTLRGDGRYASILLSVISSTSTPMLAITYAGAAIDGVSLRDIGFTSLSTEMTGAMAGGEAQLVYLDFCRNARIDRCSFVGGYATQLYVGRPQGVVINESEFHGQVSAAGGYTGVTGIMFGASSAGAAGQASRIESCVIRDFRVTTTMHTNRGLPIFTGTGISLLQAAGSEFAVVGCDIENNDISIDENTSRNLILQNSMESGGYYFSVNAPPNAGNGTFSPTATPVANTALQGMYKLVCTTAGGSGTGVFTLYDPAGTAVGTYTSNAPAPTNQPLSYTIVAGTMAWGLNDQFLYAAVSTVSPFTGNASTLSQNTGDGTVTMLESVGGGSPATLGTSPMSNYFLPSVGIVGSTLIQCTTAVPGGGIFTVYDPNGVILGTVTVGSASTFYINTTGSGANALALGIKITAGAMHDFVMGDSFAVAGTGDTLIRIGNSTAVQASLYAQNTISMDQVENTRFFDCISYSSIQIMQNYFISPRGRQVYFGPGNSDLTSSFRTNNGLNCRLGIYTDPSLADGTWAIDGNIEPSTTSGTDAETTSSPTPSVSNLQTLVLQNSTLTTITDFVGGHNGQIIAVVSNESPVQTTLNNGPNIVLKSGADELVLRNTYYNFRATSGASGGPPVWRQYDQYDAPPALQMETATYLAHGITAGAAPTTPAFQQALDQVVIALKAASLWTTFDAFWLFAVNDLKLAAINLVMPGTYDLTWPYATLPTFKPYFGVNGDAMNIYGAPSPALPRNGTGPTQNQLNSTSLSVWSPQTFTEGSYAIGTSMGSHDRLAPHSGGSLKEVQARINDSSTLTIGSNLNCLVSAVRQSSAGKAIYVNAGTPATDSSGTTVVTGDNFYLMRDGAVYHSRVISMAAIGAGRGPTDELNLYHALLPFMTSLGVVT